MYFPKSPLTKLPNFEPSLGGRVQAGQTQLYEDIPPGCVRRGVLPHPAPAPQPAAAGAGRDGPLRVRRGDAG